MSWIIFDHRIYSQIFFTLHKMKDFISLLDDVLIDCVKINCGKKFILKCKKIHYITLVEK